MRRHRGTALTRRLPGCHPCGCGALIAAIGCALVVGAFERQRNKTVMTLGSASAATLAAADLYFVAKGQIPRVYLGDAAADAALIAGWIVD